MTELDEWDPWLTPTGECSNWQLPTMSNNPSPYDRKLVFLQQVQRACSFCSMCELGLQTATKGNIEYDPHVFSNLNPKRVIIVGQGPGWEEVKLGTPFVGPSGDNFNQELAKHGLSRNDFYITNSIKCWVKDNAKPTIKQRERCLPFLEMELNCIKPHLVVTLGASAWESMCPDVPFGEGISRQMVKSSKFGVHVFAVYHPSPRNLIARRPEFESQIKLLCALIKRLHNSSAIPS